MDGWGSYGVFPTEPYSKLLQGDQNPYNAAYARIYIEYIEYLISNAVSCSNRRSIPAE